MPFCVQDLVCLVGDGTQQTGIVQATSTDFQQFQDTFYDLDTTDASFDPQPHQSIDIHAFSEFAKESIPPKGTVVVVWSWLGPCVQLVATSALRITSRRVVPGQLVIRPDHSGQQGTVLGIRSLVDVRPHCLVSDREISEFCKAQPVSWPEIGEEWPNSLQKPSEAPSIVRGIDLGDLKPAIDMHKGHAVISKGWFGIITQIDYEHTVRLFNGTVVKVGRDARITTVGLTPSPMHIGNLVQVRQADLRLGVWIFGEYLANEPPWGVIVDKTPVNIIVAWENLKSPRDELGHPVLERESIPPHPALTSDDFSGDDFHVYDLLKASLGLSGDRRTADTAAHGPVVQSNRFRFHDQEAAKSKYSSTQGSEALFAHSRAVNLGYDMNVFEIVASSTQLKVQWQDGSTTEEDSLAVQISTNMPGTSLMPGSIVATRSMLPLENNPTAGFADIPDKVGIVQAIDLQKSLLRVRWFTNPHLYLERADEIVVGPDYKLGEISEKIDTMSTYDVLQLSTIEFGILDYVQVYGHNGASMTWAGHITEMHLDGHVMVRHALSDPIQDVKVHLDDIELLSDFTVHDINFVGDPNALDVHMILAAINDQDPGSAYDAMDMDDHSESEPGFTVEHFDDFGRPIENAGSEDASMWSTEDEDDDSGATHSDQPMPTTISTIVQAADSKPSEIRHVSYTPLVHSPKHYVLLETGDSKAHKYFDRPHDHSGSALKKIMRDHKILRDESALPEGIYVRSFENRVDLFRALFIGSPGTPYALCPFIFDIYLPTTYPSLPPQVSFHHVSGFQLGSDDRINPNLYENGKVCLSLLNTWPGQATEEGWVPNKSTLLQVLVSIQGLILVAKPYFNEPGFERKEDAATLAQSLAYNERVLLHSREFLLDALESLRPNEQRTRHAGLQDVLRWLYFDDPAAPLLPRLLTIDRDMSQQCEDGNVAISARDGITSISEGAALALKSKDDKLNARYETLRDPKVISGT